MSLERKENQEFFSLNFRNHAPCHVSLVFKLARDWNFNVVSMDRTAFRLRQEGLALAFCFKGPLWHSSGLVHPHSIQGTSEMSPSGPYALSY